MNWFKLANISSETNVPLEPETVQIPDDHIRLFHYFPSEEIENIRTEGINIEKAKGESYGEPIVVWASGIKPSPTKTFVEFSVPRNDPRLLLGKSNEKEDIQTIRDRRWDMTFGQTIKPEEFIAIHEPWHNHYRYIINDPTLTKEVRLGKFDHLLDDPDYFPAIRAIKELQ